jgi:hypothetical protein
MGHATHVTEMRSIHKETSKEKYCLEYLSIHEKTILKYLREVLHGSSCWIKVAYYRVN